MHAITLYRIVATEGGARHIATAAARETLDNEGYDWDSPANSHYDDTEYAEMIGSTLEHHIFPDIFHDGASTLHRDLWNAVSPDVDWVEMGRLYMADAIQERKEDER